MAILTPDIILVRELIIWWKHLCINNVVKPEEILSLLMEALARKILVNCLFVWAI